MLTLNFPTLSAHFFLQKTIFIDELKSFIANIFIVLLQTHKKPVTEYEAIREKAASQKRDLERALNKFKTKTSETESLFFNSENDAFPRKSLFCDLKISINSEQAIDLFFN